MSASNPSVGSQGSPGDLGREAGACRELGVLWAVDLLAMVKLEACQYFNNE